MKNVIILLFFPPYPHNGKASIKGVIDDAGQAKLEELFFKNWIVRNYTKIWLLWIRLFWAKRMDYILLYNY
jgi:hypothetical protein